MEITNDITLMITISAILSLILILIPIIVFNMQSINESKIIDKDREFNVFDSSKRLKGETDIDYRERTKEYLCKKYGIKIINKGRISRFELIKSMSFDELIQWLANTECCIDYNKERCDKHDLDCVSCMEEWLLEEVSRDQGENNSENL